MRGLIVLMTVILILQMGTLAYGLYIINSFDHEPQLVYCSEVNMALDKEDSYGDILQLILNSYRKLKRKPHGFFTEGLIEQYNHLVEEIASYINAKRKEKIEESIGLPSFVWFKKKIRSFIPEDEMVDDPFFTLYDEDSELN